MQQKYIDWIENNIPNSLHGACSADGRWINTLMSVFPELVQKRGYVKDNFGMCKPHTWLVDEEGIVLDPNWYYFKQQDQELAYEEYVGDTITGNCPCCCKYTTAGNTYCSQECADRHPQIKAAAGVAV